MKLLPGKQYKTPATGETNTAPRVEPTAAPRVTKPRKNKRSPRVLATPERPQPKHNQGRNTRSSTATTILANGTIIRKLFEDNKYYEGEITGYNATDKWYKVKYLDGGIEDLDEEEMKPLTKTIQQYEHKTYHTQSQQKCPLAKY